MTAAFPEQVAAAAPVAAGLEGLPPRRHRQRPGHGHGRQRHRRRPGRRGQLAVPAGADGGVQGLRPAGFVSPGTLCFAVSFSGNTEETIEAAQAAAAAGARVVAVCRGGELGELAPSGASRTCRSPTASPSRAPGWARWPSPCGRARAGRPVPRRLRRGSRPRSDSSRSAVTRCSPATPPTRSPARSAARSRSSSAPAHRCGRRPALEGPGQRERQGAGLRRHHPRAVPQRGVRLGPARRHDPPGVHSGRAAPRRGAPAGGAPLRPGARAARRGRPRGGRGAGHRRGRPGPGPRPHAAGRLRVAADGLQRGHRPRPRAGAGKPQGGAGRPLRPAKPRTDLLGTCPRRQSV